MNYRARSFIQVGFQCSLLCSAVSSRHPKQVFAQEQKGAIAGNVTDQTGAVLRGAQVSIASQDLNVVSNEQGLFFINDLAPGNYTLTITYVGFATFTKTVDVVAGQTANVDAQAPAAIR